MNRNLSCSLFATAFVASFVLHGCSQETAQVVVLVHSDYNVPDELQSVRSVVRGVSGGVDEHDFDLAGAGIQMPFSFGLKPSTQQMREDAILELEARGTNVGGMLQVSRKFVEFPEEGTYLLPIFLARMCVDTMCPSGESCGRDGCVSNEVRVSELAPIGQEGSEFMATTCVAGERRCSADRTASEVCVADGFPFASEICPNNSQCDPLDGLCHTVGVNPGDEVELTMTIVGPGTNAVHIVVPGETQVDICGSPGCTFSYRKGTTVRLEPHPSPFTEFALFNPDFCADPPCLVTLTESQTIGAAFVPAIQVHVSGRGMVDMQVNNGAISTCGADQSCPLGVPAGTTVTLNAFPDIDHEFTGWLDAPGCGAQPLCSFLVNQGQAVTAQFRPLNTAQYNLTITGDAGNGGRVWSDPPGIDCPGSCSASFNQFEFVRLFADPDSQQAFDGWEAGPCVGTQLCFITMDSPNVSQGVRFKSMPVGGQIEIRSWGDGFVYEMGNRGNLDCGGDCWGDYDGVSSVTVVAEPPPGALFFGWADPHCSTFAEVCTLPSVNGHFALEPQFGPTRFPVHDINADGIEELAVGCPRQDAGLTDAGRLYLLTGPLPAMMDDLPRQANFTYEGVAAGDRFGSSVAFIDDINGDGLLDMAVGAPGFDNDRGAVFIFSGSTSLPPSGPASTIHTITGENQGDRFGASIAGTFDTTNDGYFDMVVGAPGASRVYIFQGGPNFTAVNALDARVVFTGDPGSEFGHAIAALGEFGQDLQTYIAVGAPNFTNGGGPVGRVYLLNHDPFAAQGTVIPATAARWFFEGVPGSRRLGYSLAALGDWDSNGSPDFAMGTEMANAVFYTGPGDRANLFSGPVMGASQIIEIFGPTGAFGRSMVALDVTGDGRRDLAVGAPESGGPDKGAVYVYPSQIGGPGPAEIISDSCASTNACLVEGFGTSVGTAGDINNDGIEDLAVGSRFGGGNAGVPNRGRISIFFGGVLPPSDSSGANITLMGEPGSSAECFVVPTGDAVIPGF